MRITPRTANYHQRLHKGVSVGRFLWLQISLVSSYAMPTCKGSGAGAGRVSTISAVLSKFASLSTFSRHFISRLLSVNYLTSSVNFNMADDAKNTVYVVTGANRGLGLGLVKALLARPDTTVIATVRSQQAATALREETAEETRTDKGSLHIIELDFSTAIAPEAIRRAVDQVGAGHIDVLINNAGSVPPLVPALTTTAADLRAAFETDTIAPLLVFQALWPLLQKSSSSSPKLIAVTSSIGSIAEMEPLPGGAYGPSRAAKNWLTRALHQEHKDEGLIAIALHPGWVQTRAGQFAADQWGIAKGPPETVESSVSGMLQVIDTATRDMSGTFLTQTGEVLGW